MDKLKIAHLLHNTLRDYKDVKLKEVEFLKFSESGTYLSVGCSKSSEENPSWQLLVLNSYTVEVLHSFIDWSSPINSIRFCKDETLIVGMCSGGSLRFCNLEKENLSTKIALRSNKTFTSMAIYEPTDIKGNSTISVFSCSPHPKQGSIIREFKEVAKKYV